MNKFINAKIYKIVDNTSDMIYIGSTCETLYKRLVNHERCYKCFKLGKYHFLSVFKILERNNYKIELIKLYPCENKKELNIAEGLMIKQLKSDGLNVVNRNIAGLTPKQSVEQYYNKNKNKINAQRKQKNNCSCGGKFSNINKSRHEKTKKHCEFIKNQTINIAGNNYNINITININNVEDLENIQLDILNDIK
jgi:hypothetical protein